MMRSLLVLFVLTAIPACWNLPPGRVTGIVPTPETACQNLKTLGCPEATPSCAEVMRKAGELQDMKLACVTNAASPDAVRQCGTVRCGP